MATNRMNATGRRGASFYVATVSAVLLAVLGAYALWSSQPRGMAMIGAGSSPSSPSEPAETASVGVDGEITGREALQRQLELLEEGRRRLLERRDYTCTLVMRERVNGELLEDEIDFAARHQPFSVSLTWTGEGRRAVYVEGQNDNQMVVSLGGWKRLLGRLKLAPDDPRARSRGRYPITEAGLLKLTDRVIEYRERDLALSEGVSCTMYSDREVEGRECFCFVVEYTDPEIEPVYQTSIIHIDRELLLPIAVTNYTWSARGGDKRDDDALIEHYVYRDLQFDRGLTDEDFEIDPRRRSDAS